MKATDLTSYIASEPAVFQVVFWASCAMLGLILLLLLILFVLRLRYLYRVDKRCKVRELWQPVFSAIREIQPYQIPRHKPSELFYILELWVEQRPLLTDAQGRAMDKLAGRINLSDAIVKVLRPDPIRLTEKPHRAYSVALDAFQWLYSNSLLRYVHHLADSEDLYLAVSACAVLTRLKAPDYEQAVITLYFKFPGQSAYISSQLSLAGAGEILQTMEPFLDSISGSMRENLLALADHSSNPELLPLLERQLETAEAAEHIAILVRNIGRLGNSSDPEYTAAYLALVGSKSDNIPGIHGIGPKTAANLLDGYQNLENLISNAGKIKGNTGKRLRNNIKQLRHSYQLVIMKQDEELKISPDNSGNSRNQKQVAHYLDHECSFVRLQAIKALGRLGNQKDVKMLVPFLSDREWWVRYRAARSVIRLMKRDSVAIEKFKARLHDPFARDILNHAFVEMQWCLQ